MYDEPKSRQQKLVEKLYPYFGDMADNKDDDEYAQRICRHLLRLQGDAINSKYAAPFITIWDSEHPEEDSLTNDELLWVLDMLDDHISSQLHDIQLNLTNENSPRARFKVIQGGRPRKPSDPFDYDNNTGHKIGF